MDTHILVVDDEAAIADLVEVYLKNEGYTVHKFYDAAGALDCVAREHLDLAILDVMLPDISGFTLCGEIRKSHRFIQHDNRGIFQNRSCNGNALRFSTG